ncbi:MAG: excinuclease ABC subunit C, partial [Actinomycetota bacterium]
VSSSLDGIPGLGETRAKRLVKEMGGVNAVKKATREDLGLLSWLPAAVADAIHARFHPAAEGTEAVAPVDSPHDI